MTIVEDTVAPDHTVLVRFGEGGFAGFTQDGERTGKYPSTGTSRTFSWTNTCMWRPRNRSTRWSVGTARDRSPLTNPPSTQLPTRVGPFPNPRGRSTARDPLCTSCLQCLSRKTRCARLPSFASRLLAHRRQGPVDRPRLFHPRPVVFWSRLEDG